MHLRKTKKCTVEIKNKDENRSLFYGIITISHVKISIYNLIHHSVSILLAYTPPCSHTNCTHADRRIKPVRLFIGKNTRTSHHYTSVSIRTQIDIQSPINL